ncbi:hypothetical protein CLOAM1336 [Candidatus Cloacimonas acidaminovorans str. Evry]|uniref:Uncharacterized protein n=1 Tax=Cloacimonas acidaminovorans (strain Evry) TaxID=459349 RepID=B0VIQ1_CLOAI|nr:hypothetical protein CLOAM1336 [Candidatus Cloacimonas acidaminovorans str. Evry]
MLLNERRGHHSSGKLKILIEYSVAGGRRSSAIKIYLFLTSSNYTKN